MRGTRSRDEMLDATPQVAPDVDRGRPSSLPQAATRPVSLLLTSSVVRYGIVGASGTLIDIALLTLLHGVMGVPLLAANLVSFSVAATSNYLLNRRWTFGTRGQRPIMLGGLLFFVAAVVGLSLSEAGVWILSERLDLPYLWAKILSIPVVYAWNYTFNSSITFRHQASAIIPDR